MQHTFDTVITRDIFIRDNKDFTGQITLIWTNGKKCHTTNYKAGVWHGLYECWWYNGNIRERSNWRNGEKCGKEEYWREDGRIQEVITQEQTGIIREEKYNQSGIKIRDVLFANGIFLSGNYYLELSQRSSKVNYKPKLTIALNYAKYH